MGSSRREESNRSCCTWPRILLLVILLAVAGVCVWKFVPWEDSINNVLGAVPIPDNNSNGGGTNSNIAKPNTVETASPTASPMYEFIQCDDTSGTGDCCNGLEGICDLRANEVLYATLHNGMATFEDGFLFGPNHKYQLESALKAGYRGLNLDLCNCGGETIFCHGICTLGPRKVVDVMQNVNAFLDENPSEVIIFIYQVNNDVDQQVDLNAFYDKLTQVDGVIDKLYIHDDMDSPWPTLRDLTNPAVNKRIIMFHYNGPDCNLDPSACPDGLHLYYLYAQDNEWSNDNIASIQDTTTSCELKQNGINRNWFVGLNNFISPPSQSSAQVLNSYSAANDYVDTCSSVLGTDINFIISDFWSEGELPRFTQDHNTARALQRRLV